MKKPIQISIPTPCHEEWGKMTPVEKGRFCDSCQKNVIDITKLSDDAVQMHLDMDSDICVKAHQSQLNRQLNGRQAKSKRTAISLAALSILALGSFEASAQKVSDTTYQQPVKIKSKEDSKEVLMISGIVTDSINPINAAYVSLVRKKRWGKKKKIIHTITTKEDGTFSIEANAGDEIFIVHDDYEPIIIEVSGQSNYFDIILVKKSEMIYLGNPKVQRSRLRTKKNAPGDE